MALTATGFKADRHNLLTVTPANPAAGVDVVWPCPANRVVEIISVSFMFVTAAAVVDRIVTVDIIDATANIVQINPPLVVQPAGLMWDYSFNARASSLDRTAINNYQWVSLCLQMQMKSGESLRVHPISMAAADQLGNPIIRYREWNED